MKRVRNWAASEVSGLIKSRIFLRISVLGINLKGLLDSGASGTVLGKRGIQKLASLNLRRVKVRPGRVRVADGRFVSQVGIISLPITFDGKVRVFSVPCVPDFDCEIILGLDFWEEMNLMPSIRSDLIVPGEEDELENSGILIPHDSLDGDQKAQLKRIIDLYRSKANTCRIGLTDKAMHTIDTGDAKPIKQRYYPVSPHVQREMDAELDKMLQDDVIEPSKSPWSSPAVLVRKPDGSIRFCVDYRRLNAVTKKDAYPLPYVSNILDRLRDAQYLTSLDIKSAYWQVPIAPQDREKTAFVVPNRGLFHFKVLSFGLCSAPATWQRLIDSVLGADLEPFCFVYLDDIIIVTSTFGQHLEIVEKVLDRLHNAKLTLNWEKSQFCRSELRYLGYVIDSTGLHVDPEKISAILDFPQPRTPRQVRQFIGLAAWYRRFVPNFASVAAPLTDLTRKHRKWEWADPQKRAFHKLKALLVSAPVLTCPDFSRPFQLQTDASGTGLGAILSQVFDDGEKPVAYASRALTPAEKSYSATELECLAVIWAVDKFRPYLEGSKFEVITDHHSLKWLNNLKDPHGRLARWALRLQEHDFVIRHRPGSENQAPDALSRAHEVSIVEIIPEEIQDRWYLEWRDKVAADPDRFPSWRVENGRLFRKVERTSTPLDGVWHSWKEVVPKERRREVLSECHDSALSGHLGIFKTLRRVQEHFFWPGMVSDTSKYVSRCQVCLAQKPQQKKPAGMMGTGWKVSRPWEVVSVDIVGPLPRSKKGFRYILVASDYFSKFTLLFPLRQATAKEVCEVLEKQLILLFGPPETIISDNGSQFISQPFRELLREHNIRSWYTSRYHPQANPAERVNRVVKTMLRSYLRRVDQGEWDQVLPKIGYAIRTAVHEVTGYTPAFLMYGRELGPHRSKPQDSDKDTPMDFESRQGRVSQVENLQLIFEEVQQRLRLAYEKSARDYNLRRSPAPNYREGQVVWKKEHPVSDAAQGIASKLCPRYRKVVITKRLSPTTFRLADESGRDIGIYHVQELKPHPYS